VRWADRAELLARQVGDPMHAARHFTTVASYGGRFSSRGRR
jgi:hypothetical protein